MPSAKSRQVISRQMRCPFLNRLAVARISIAYSFISPGTTGFAASLVNGCQGSQGRDLRGSTARLEALSQPRVSSLSLRSAGVSSSPGRAVLTDSSGPTSLRMTIQLVSGWSSEAYR